MSQIEKEDSFGETNPIGFAKKLGCWECEVGQVVVFSRQRQFAGDHQLMRAFADEMVGSCI